MVRSRKHTRAFTLVELLVSVGIFALMTALIVAKYGNFNNGVLLTNAAYDVALAIRTAQTYGLSVRSTETGVLPGSYGIYFNLGNTSSTVCSGASPSSTTFYLFWSSSGSSCSSYQSEIISSFSLKQGMTISALCSGNSASSCVEYVDANIYFKRPDPDALIYTYCQPGPVSCWQGSNFTSAGNFIRITIRASNGDTRNVDVYKNGQISVNN